MTSLRAIQTRTRALRGRTTRKLIELAYERFYACDACSREAYDYLEDVLGPLRLLCSEYNRLSRFMTCPSCDRRLNDPSYDRVAGYSVEELRANRRYRTVHENYVQKYARCFERFQSFLTDYPLLGGLHPFGRDLAKAVGQARVVKLEPAPWYRAIVNHRKRIPRKRFAPPDPKKLDRGTNRFNSFGQPGYYLADSRETAALEVLRSADRVAWLDDGSRPLLVSNVATHLGVTEHEARRLISLRRKAQDVIVIAEVKLQRDPKVLDIRVRRPGDRGSSSTLLEGLVFTGALRQPTDPSDKSTPQYRVPQFLADLVRARRLDGIVYSSNREAPSNPETSGTNLVLFGLPGEFRMAISKPMRYRWRGVRELSINDLASVHLELFR